MSSCAFSALDFLVLLPLPFPPSIVAVAFLDSRLSVFSLTLTLFHTCTLYYIAHTAPHLERLALS